MAHYSYPLNDERERLLDKIEAETEASTKAEAIDTALKHYLEDKENRQEYADQIPPEKMKLLNTSQMKVAYYPKVR